MSDNTGEGIPVSFWLSLEPAVVLTISSLVLTSQRIYHRRQQKIKKEHFKVDTTRDYVNHPFSNGNRMSRIIFETLLSTAAFGYLFVNQVLYVSDHKNDTFAVYTVIGLAVQFFTWIYALVLAGTASRYPLPNELGWNLNVHMAFIYLGLSIPTMGNFVTTLWNNPSVSFAQLLPVALPTILTMDLLYTTVTVKNGAPFLDENGKIVNGFEVASILETLYFSWLTPVIQLVNARGSKLTDNDLPTLPTTHRAHNMFYVFGERRGRGLLYRLYMSNRYAINAQAFYASVLPVFYYATPFFLNRLLLVIQEITSGNTSEGSYVYAFGCILGMATFTVIQNVMIAQLWYYAQSNVQLRVKSMLNLEIYRKTLRRMDTSVISGGKGKKEQVKKDDEDEENEAKIDEDDVSSKTGMIVNLMSTDSARISDFASWWFVIIEAPLELTVGIYFLYTLLGWSCILGLMAMVITIPVNHYNSKLFVKKQDQLMKSRDKRVSLMNEVLQGIRQIKFFAWESNWTKRILEARDIELAHLKTVCLTDIVFMALWNGTPLLVTTLSFWSFTKLEGRELTAPIAFTSITIFNELRGSLTIIPETVIHLFESLISVRRIQKYLEEEEIKQSNSDMAPSLHQEVKIGFENATIGWPSATSEENNVTRATTPVDSSSDSTIDQDEPSTFVLKDLNVIFPNNELSLICGATGSGKTLMMLSLLGETEIKKGGILCPRSASSSTLDDTTAITSIKVTKDADAVPKDWILEQAVAYVSQTAWLRNASIKDNILFGLPFVQKRYKATIAACALEKDLNYLEDGDETEIGEKGITLSGGQKARVALARAVYSRAQNILLDDVLSAVDAHTAKHLYKQCLLGSLMKGRTQVLITHHVNLCIQSSAYVVFVKDGRIKLSGTPSELKEANQLSQIFEENVKEEETIEEEEATLIVEEQLSPATEVNEDKKKPKVLVEEEQRAAGRVKLRLYKMYFGLIGGWKFWIFIIASIIGARSLDIVGTWWLKKWAQSYEDPTDQTGNLSLNAFSLSPSAEFAAPKYQWPQAVSSNLNYYFSTTTVISSEQQKSNLNLYLGIYVLINITQISVIIIRYAASFFGGIRASRKLYILLLNRVFRAPLRFFDTTPVGRIVNRFSKDFETIDASVPTNTVQFLVQWTTIISIVIVATSVFPVLIVLMVVAGLINIYLGFQFVGASRELKRMDSVSRSPLFTHFSETIIGVTTIRAFGMSQQFMLDMINRVDLNARPMYYAWTVSRWVSTRIAVMGAIVSLVTGVFILSNLDHIDAATAGFCLSYVLIFTNMTYWGVRRYTILEMDFNSVERVVEFLDMDQEAPAITDIRTPTNWPSEGGIEVTDLEARYASDLEPVLKGLTFSVKPREKIGIVGRTGSGKSTLALAFFRFLELSAGKIVIDGVNISDIGTEYLRSNLTIIPQDPVLFSGTLQSNMDPFNQFSDEEIFTTLRRVHLLNDTDNEDVNENVFRNLQTPVSEGGSNFSQGQRQLLCLARALLKRSRIVLMDEATASVDFETDKAIQKTITTEFASSTILCIAHRLNTVIEYDRILVLDHGNIVEFASPMDLLRDNNSVFYKMCKNSGEFENLVQLAKAKHELVDTS